MKVVVFELLAGALGISLAFFPVWWMALAVWQGREKQVSQARFFPERLMLPRWISARFHRIFIPGAIFGLLTVIPLLLMGIGAWVNSELVDEISSFRRFYILYWVLISLLCLASSMTVVLWGRPIFLVAKHERGQLSALELRRRYR